MIPLPPAMEESLTFAHYRQVRLEVLDGATVTEVPLVDGKVDIEAGGPIRRRAQVDIAVPPLTTDAQARAFSESLVAGGVWLRLTWVMTLMDGRRFEVPVGLLRAESSEWVSGAGVVKVTAFDLGQQVADDRFLTPRTMSDASKVNALGVLLAESVPGYPLTVDPGLDDDPLTETTWDVDRDKAVIEVATALGAWVFWRHDGGWRLQPVPDGSAQSVWTVDGDDVMLAASGTASRDGTYNAVAATGQLPAGAPDTDPVPFGVAYDLEPGSPTFWDGLFGHKPRFYSSPVMSTDAQCLAAAESILSRSKGLTRSLKFDAVAHPGLEPGDVVEFSTASTGPVEPGRYLVDTVSLPLGAGGMSMSVRFVRGFATWAEQDGTWAGQPPARTWAST